MRIPAYLRHFTTPVLLLLLPWLAFSPSLHGVFVFDDLSGIVENQAVHNLDHVGEMARFWQPSDVSYRPLRNFSYAVNWVQGDGDPLPFHQTNLWLQGLGAIALWLLLGQILPQRRWALWVTLFWLVHPLQSEAVAYVSGRKDLLATLFYFIALNGAVVRARARQQSRRLLAATVFVFAAALSFLAKETALTLPAAALALDLMLDREGNLRQRLTAALRGGPAFYGLIAVGGAGALFYKLILAPGTKLEFNLLTAPLTNLPLALQSYAFYLRKLVWPWPLVADLRGLFPARLGLMGGWGVFWNGGSVLVSLLGLGIGGLLAAAARGTNRYRIVAGSLALYVITALPVANLIPLNEPAAEHYAHLPLAALLVALVGAATTVADRLHLPGRAQWLVGAGLLLVLTGSSWHRSRVWTSADSLWSSVIAVHDGSDRAWSNLGLVRLATGDETGAQAAFRRALATGQTPQPRIVANLMQSLRTEGDLRAAIATGRQGLAAHPDDPLLLSLTGGALLAAGNAAEARTLLDRVEPALGGDRVAAPGWQRDRGLAHAMTGDPAGGERMLRAAARADTSDASTLASLGWLLLGQKRWAEADTTLARAVALPEASGIAWRNRAVVLLKLGRAAEAAQALDEAEARGDQVPPSLREAVSAAGDR